MLFPLDDDNPPVSFVKFSPNGKYILAATLDKSVLKHKFAPIIESGICLIKKLSKESNMRFFYVAQRWSQILHISPFEWILVGF